MFEGKFKGNKALKKKVRREYKALKKSGDVKKAKDLGLSKKEMKSSIRTSIAEKAVIRRKAFAVKKASDSKVRQEESKAAASDQVTERKNRAAERQASMQAKADVVNKERKESSRVSDNNDRVRSNISNRKAAKGDYYQHKESDGSTRKVKVSKKAQEGAKVKAKSFGVLKSDANKVGPKKEEGKEPYSKNGVNYTWDRKNSVWRGDADKGINNKSRAVKKK